MDVIKMKKNNDIINVNERISLTVMFHHLVF